MKKGIALLLTSLFISAANAEEVQYERLCGKIKQCALDEARKQSEIPPQMEQMIEAMFDSQCKVMLEGYTQTFEDAGLTNKAVACSDSILEMSCDELMAQQGEPNTPACKDFKEAADEAGIDLENIDAK